jgi:uncharacterized repeat protein (TIGR02543 family)
MKKLTLLTIGALLALNLLAQAPQGISHQAVIRDAANQPVTESTIGIQVSILQGSAEGTVVYSETHLPTSNSNGLISFVIGQGTVVNGVFAEINWPSGPYFIKSEADPAGGANYTITGISQVWNIPYALFSQKSETLKDGNVPGEILYWSGLEWIAIQPGDHNQVLRLCNGVPTWGNCKYLLTLVAQPENGGVVSGAEQYEAGAQVNITATANIGWQFVNWTDTDGIVSQAPNFLYTMPATDVTLTANFEMIDYKLTLVANPTEGGSVSGGGDYNLGDAVQLGAVANTGWQFVNWTDNDGIVSAAANFTYTMPAADVTLTANFEEEQVGFTCGVSTVPTLTATFTTPSSLATNAG